MRAIQTLNLLLLTALLSGCWTLGVSKGVAPGRLGNTDLLESLIGQKSENVIRELGLPIEVIEDEDKRFMIYSGYSADTDVLMFVWIPIPVATGSSDNLHCLRIELDSDNLVTGYQHKSKSLDYFVTFAEFSVDRKCREVFWYQRELAKLQVTTSFPSEWFKIIATQGNPYTQLALFKDLRGTQPKVALVWLCRSADSGSQEAKIILKTIYENGGYPWIERGIVEPDFSLAYVWFVLSGANSYSSQAYLASRTAEERLDAEKMLKEWQPGNCERELGLVWDELSNIN